MSITQLRYVWLDEVKSQTGKWPILNTYIISKGELVILALEEILSLKQQPCWCHRGYLSLALRLEMSLTDFRV